ncbi:MAG: thioredoxin domain-containing protein [Rickettsiales bacterium]|nr:thioredoxin domain-containing protein [Rickettsiales bacterium]
MIQWHEWDEASLAKAKAENKPIFLSVGYFACYWCHVMEKRVYSDEAFADVLNNHFIAIKVDRDKRPDVNEIYQRARTLITKQSGWPNHVYLTPEGEPFLACGVMLPEYGRNLTQLSQDVAERWKASEAQLREAAGHIATIIRDELSVEVLEGDGTPDKSVVSIFHDYLSQHYDAEYGSFYTDPKFPHENYLLFLLSEFRHTKDESSLEMVRQSLKKMAAGAMNDAVGGGFHRYCVDKEWRAPHFEKMLYNQALLGRCYAELYVLTNKPYYRDIAQQTMDFVLRELTAPSGAFYSALDAETDGVEGAYYVWTEDELHATLAPEERDFFSKSYGLADLPVYPGHEPVDGKALYARRHLMELANEKNRSYESFRDSLNPILGKLRAARDERKRPDRDEKVIAGWNGLMIDTLARASKIFERDDYLQAALKAATHLCDSLIEDTILLRIEGAEIHGFLEDYAYFEAGLLTLYEITRDEQWLKQARKIHRTTNTVFWDAEKGGYFMTDGVENLLVRIHKGHDTGLPAANGVMLHNILRLWEITGDEKWLGRARVIMAVYEKAMKEMPADYSTMIQAMLYLHTRKTGHELS